MSRGWKNSMLIPGETVTTNLFEEKAKPSRIEYIDDFAGGLLLRFFFGAEEERSYVRSVPYASIYCGDVKVWDQNGKQVRIHHEEDSKWDGFKYVGM